LRRLQLEQANATPFVYNGEANFHTFQKWTQNTRLVQTELHTSQVPSISTKKICRRTCLHLLHERYSPRPHQMDSRFPLNFRSLQRDKFDAFAQWEHPVQEYKRDLEDLAESVGDIQPQQLAAKFWHGADKHLCARMAESGLDPKETSLLQLAEAAERFEYAERLRKTEDSKRDSHLGKPKQGDFP
jgi:hypothetical protein